MTQRHLACPCHLTIRSDTALRAWLLEFTRAQYPAALPAIHPVCPRAGDRLSLCLSHLQKPYQRHIYRCFDLREERLCVSNSQKQTKSPGFTDGAFWQGKQLTPSTYMPSAIPSNSRGDSPHIPHASTPTNTPHTTNTATHTYTPRTDTHHNRHTHKHHILYNTHMHFSHTHATHTQTHKHHLHTLHTFPTPHTTQ